MLLAIATMACGTSGPCPRTLAADGASSDAHTEIQWTEVATDYGEIAIPVGWHIRARQSPDPIFDLYSRDPELAVFALTVQFGGPETSMREALRRQLRDIGAPANLMLTTHRTKWQYGEAAMGPGRVFAACAVDYDAAEPVAVLAVARLMNSHSVSQRLYQEAGGREMLCGIAASARRLKLVSP